MRAAFVKKLTELAEKDERVYLLTADLGFSVFEDFAKRFPQRFINCGVAEQNMMGVAAGLALSGKKVYTYSITPFATMRCFEQIRDDICYQNLDVKIIGFGAGLHYGSLGATHLAIEDVAVLRALPNMTVLCPADPVETEELMEKSYQTANPTYLRLCRQSGVKIYDSTPLIEIGKPSVLKDGKDGIIIASGIETGICLEVVEELKKIGKEFKLLSFHTLKPINKEELLKEVGAVNPVFAVEEHSVIGGLGGALAEILAESDWQGKFKIISLPDAYPLKIGSPEYMRDTFSLTKEKILATIISKI